MNYSNLNANKTGTYKKELKKYTIIYLQSKSKSVLYCNCYGNSQFGLVTECCMLKNIEKYIWSQFGTVYILLYMLNNMADYSS